MLCRTAPIDFSDPLLELLPEVYIESAVPTAAEVERVVDRMARDTAAFLVRFGREQIVGEFDESA